MSNQYQDAIRERMSRTGEKYSVARRNWLREHGLPLDTATSRVTARRRQRKLAKLAEEYGDTLGVDLSTMAKEPPQLGDVVVEQRRRGRVVR